MSRTKFLYHAYAAGLGGNIHRPFEHTLEVQAAAALPPSGGASSGQALNVEIRDYLRCAKVTSRASGKFNPATETFETYSTSSVEGFDIGKGMITADLIRSTLHSSFRLNAQAPFIVPDGSAIINFKINGAPIEIKPLTDVFTELNTLEKIRERHRNDEAFRAKLHEYAMIGRHAELAEHKLVHYFPFCHRQPSNELHETQHAAILPLYEILTPSGRGFRVFQNVIYIENFGRLQLGQLIVLPHERRITGLHIDLGSPTGGDVDCSSVATNGVPIDPP